MVARVLDRDGIRLVGSGGRGRLSDLRAATLFGCHAAIEPTTDRAASALIPSVCVVGLRKQYRACHNSRGGQVPLSQAPCRKVLCSIALGMSGCDHGQSFGVERNDER
jgi:hypothetical protein